MGVEALSTVVPVIVGLALLTVLLVPQLRPRRLSEGVQQWQTQSGASREVQIVASVLVVAAIVASGQWVTGGTFDGGSTSLAMVLTLVGWIPFIWGGGRGPQL